MNATCDDRKISSSSNLSQNLRELSTKFVFQIGTGPISLYTFPVVGEETGRSNFAVQGPTVWASTSPSSSLISFSRKNDVSDQEYFSITPSIHRIVCKSRSDPSGGNVGFGSSNKSIPVPSVSLGGILVATVDGSGSLLFGTIDHRRAAFPLRNICDMK